MKTCEQVTADVFARRDTYLAERARKRRAVKRYALTGLLLFAAAFAAAGLFRAGISDSAPVSLYGRETATAAFAEPSDGFSAPQGAKEDATRRETTTLSRAASTQPESAVDLSPHGHAYMAAEPSATAGGKEPSARRDPETTVRRPEPTGETTPSPPAEPTRPLTEPTARLEPQTVQKGAPPRPGAPTEEPTDETTTRPVPTEETSPAPTDSGPTDFEDATSEPREERLRHVYVLYEGAVYAAEMAAPTLIPADAEALAEKDAFVADGGVIADAELASQLFASPASAWQESDPAALLSVPGGWDAADARETRITLLSLPQDASGRIGVTLAGIDGMFELAYVCAAEELT